MKKNDQKKRGDTVGIFFCFFAQYLLAVSAIVSFFPIYGTFFEIFFVIFQYLLLDFSFFNTNETWVYSISNSSWILYWGWVLLYQKGFKHVLLELIEFYWVSPDFTVFPVFIAFFVRFYWLDSMISNDSNEILLKLYRFYGMKRVWNSFN